jgi:hypothetical protein
LKDETEMPSFTQNDATLLTSANNRALDNPSVSGHVIARISSFATILTVKDSKALIGG